MDKYKVKLGNYDIPLVIGPLGALKVDAEPYSYLDGFKLLENQKGCYAEISSDNGTLYAKSYRKQKIMKNAHLEIVTVVRNTYHGQIFMPSIPFQS